MQYLLGVDFGGSSTKATLIDQTGTILAENTVFYETYHPSVGFCEQQPDEWNDALCRNLKELFEKAGVNTADIAAVAIDSATHTWVAADEAMRPLFAAIHWTDSRSKAQADRLRASSGELIYAQTFHKPDTIWTLPQMLWVKENHPEQFARIRHIFFEKDYIRWFLTGVWCTDVIEAQGTMFFDSNTFTWSRELCELIGLKQEVLPPLVQPKDVIGTVTPQAAAATGLHAGTPVICGTTDTVMEVFAAGAVKKGDMTVKLATAGRICVITDRPYPDRDVVNYAHIMPGLWYPGSATKAAASSLGWYRAAFGGSHDQLNQEASRIPAGSEGLFFHPYINGELTPYADPDLCGSFTGIRSHHTKAHFSRAVMEGVAFSLLASLQKLRQLSVPVSDHAVLIGGGAQSVLWGQIVADTLDLTLTVNRSSDSSLGSAMLAGIAVGLFDSEATAVSACIKAEREILPEKENHALYQKLFGRYEQIHDALAPLYREKLL